MSYRIGDKLNGEVSGIQPYGVFVQLDEENQGLIHISELRHGFVDDVNEEVKIGEEIEVIVIDIDEYTHKISLSKRVLEEAPEGTAKKYHPRYGNKKIKLGFQTIEDNMQKSIDTTLDYIKKMKNK